MVYGRELKGLADREGWAATQAYETDDLASNFEDKKGINRAIRAANIAKNTDDIDSQIEN